MEIKEFQQKLKKVCSTHTKRFQDCAHCGMRFYCYLAPSKVTDAMVDLACDCLSDETISVDKI